jgi:hypothetical protein
MNQVLKSALRRFCKLVAISFIGSSTTALTVYQQQVFLPDGTLNWKPALGVASTAFLVSLAASVLHGLELLLADISPPPPPPPVVPMPPPTPPPSPPLPQRIE